MSSHGLVVVMNSYASLFVACTLHVGIYFVFAFKYTELRSLFHVYLRVAFVILHTSVASLALLFVCSSLAPFACLAYCSSKSLVVAVTFNYVRSLVCGACCHLFTSRTLDFFLFSCCMLVSLLRRLTSVPC